MRAVIHRDVGQRLRGEFDAVVRAVEDDLPECAERAEHFVGAQINRIGSQDRALDVVPQTLVARTQIRLKREDLRVEPAGITATQSSGK